VQHGWTVWYKQDYLIEGEFHAVWRSPEGVLSDITPKPDGERRILFVPDGEAVYANKPVSTVRVPLTKKPYLLRLIAANEKWNELGAEFSDSLGRPRIPEHEFSKLFDKLRPNDVCPCNSGFKYKRCCGKRH
jgi:hypothetical protein